MARGAAVSNAGRQPLGLPYADAQFAALEPSWAGLNEPLQLRALLVLGALFTHRLHVHDTQLADNPHVLRDFARRTGTPDNVFDLLAELLQAGVVTLGIRDGTYVALEDRVRPCDSLGDVVRTWAVRDKPLAWVVPPGDLRRHELVRSVDQLIERTPECVVRYPYRQIKQGFMAQTRDSHADPEGYVHRLVRTLDAETARRYDAIVSAPWFSHADIFELLRASGLSLDHPLVQVHGMFDEAAYGRWHAARLLGSDWGTSTIADAEGLLRSGAPKRAGRRPTGRFRLGDLAARVVDAPGVDLLATLSAQEILQLREGAQDLFLIQTLAGHREPDEAVLLDACADHWERICAHIRRTRPHLATRPTRVAVFLRRLAPALARKRGHTVSAGITVTTEFKPITGTAVLVKLASRLVESSVEFMFIADSAALRALRAAFPKRSWIVRDTRQD